MLFKNFIDIIIIMLFKNIDSNNKFKIIEKLG